MLLSLDAGIAWALARAVVAAIARGGPAALQLLLPPPRLQGQAFGRTVTAAHWRVSPSSSEADSDAGGDDAYG